MTTQADTAHTVSVTVSPTQSVESSTQRQSVLSTRYNLPGRSLMSAVVLVRLACGHFSEE